MIDKDELRRLQAKRMLPGFEPVFRGPDGEWPERPTEGPEVGYSWAGEDPSPPIVLSGRGGALNNVDARIVWDEDWFRPSLMDRIRRYVRRNR